MIIIFWVNMCRKMRKSPIAEFCPCGGAAAVIAVVT